MPPPLLGLDAQRAEAAGEIERCWDAINADAQKIAALKSEVEAAWNVIREREAEIERLKNEIDHAAIAAAFQHGFRTATSAIWPVVGTLLKDHHHGEEA